MKRSIILILSFWILINSITAQSAKDALNAKSIVWYGLDFTKAKFVGQFDQGFGTMPATGADLKSKWIPGWNTLIGAEPQNFDLKKSFHADDVYYDLAPVNAVNSKLNADEAMSLNPGKIEKGQIDDMVKKYNSGDKKSGTGIVFIVENFNKGTEMAEVYVTYFDIATKKVLITEKVSGKAAGIGMRNYWAGSIKAILKKIRSDEYKNWQSKY